MYNNSLSSSIANKNQYLTSYFTLEFSSLDLLKVWWFKLLHCLWELSFNSQSFLTNQHQAAPCALLVLNFWSCFFITVLRIQDNSAVIHRHSVKEFEWVVRYVAEDLGASSHVPFAASSSSSFLSAAKNSSLCSNLIDSSLVKMSGLVFGFVALPA